MKTNGEFWKYDSKEEVQIEHIKLKNFLERQGFANLLTGKGPAAILVKVEGQIVRPTDEAEGNRFIIKYLEDKKLDDVAEKFIKGMGNYTSSKKLGVLLEIPKIKNHDDRHTTWFYFKNTAVKVTKDTIVEIPYSRLPHLVWEDRIIQREYKKSNVGKSQFRKFCINLSGQDHYRFYALKSAIGYLLSRYKDPSNPKAVIFVDEIISHTGKANGGTGKSLIAAAIEELRNLVTVDGKRYNPSYQFSNQLIDLSTDVLCFDDMAKNFSLEDIFSMMTSGVMVNPKHKAAFNIEPQDAPKVMITSNYVVNGPGGNSDARRRCEFEVAPHYGAGRIPEDEFGNLFFYGWDELEWQKFDAFMIGCAQFYLERGLITAKPINLPKNRLIGKTSQSFVDFMGKNAIVNKRMNKREFLIDFNKASGENISQHQFDKMLREYAKENSLDYVKISTGGKYMFELIDRNPNKDENG